MKLNELKPVFLETIPSELEESILYISEKYSVSIHLCACGCKQKVVLPFKDVKTSTHWRMVNREGLISFDPSIVNFSWEKPSYHAHYYIIDNKIKWC